MRQTIEEQNKKIRKSSKINPIWEPTGNLGTSQNIMSQIGERKGDGRKPGRLAYFGICCMILNTCPEGLKRRERN